MSDATFTFRVDDDLKKQFAMAAKEHDRTGAQLLRDFMREFVQQQQHAAEEDAWFRRQVQAGLDSANAGRLTPNDQVEARFCCAPRRDSATPRTLPLMELRWTPEAIADRESIYEHVEADNPAAALALDELFAACAARLIDHPGLGRTGRVQGTRELVAHRNYILIYDLAGEMVRLLRVLHAARRWPAE